MNGILASSGAGGAAGLGSIFIMYAVVIGVFWFFLMRKAGSGIEEDKKVSGWQKPPVSFLSFSFGVSLARGL